MIIGSLLLLYEALLTSITCMVVTLAIRATPDVSKRAARTRPAI